MMQLKSFFCLKHVWSSPNLKPKPCLLRSKAGQTSDAESMETYLGGHGDTINTGHHLHVVQ